MKRILLLTILIFSITLIFQVKSYTMAKVENTANISITTSDNALIAMPEKLSFNVDKNSTENITNQLTDLGEQKVDHTIFTDYETVSSNFEIKNNMNKEIIFKVSLKENFEGITLLHNEGRLSPGGFLNNITINIDNDIEEIPDNLNVEIYAEWDGGSAVIDSQIQINVNENTPFINVNTIDLRTSEQSTLPLNEEGMKIEQNNEESFNVESNNNLNDIDVIDETEETF